MFAGPQAGYCSAVAPKVNGKHRQRKGMGCATNGIWQEPVRRSAFSSCSVSEIGLPFFGAQRRRIPGATTGQCSFIARRSDDEDGAVPPEPGGPMEVPGRESETVPVGRDTEYLSKRPFPGGTSIGDGGLMSAKGHFPVVRRLPILRNRNPGIPARRPFLVRDG